MANRIDMSGQRYGRLVVTGCTSNRNGQRYVVARCDCGVSKEMLAANLRHGRTRSCGCLLREVSSAKNRSHGMSRTPTHRVWLGMIQRCADRNCAGFRKYGGRGIAVCERWLSFENFLADMGERPPGMTIDRIDGSRGYEPGNCRWATYREQARNTRRNCHITANGETKLLIEWAEDSGLHPSTIRSRLRDGWAVAPAVTTPRRTKRRAELEGKQ